MEYKGGFFVLTIGFTSILWIVIGGFLLMIFGFLLVNNPLRKVLAPGPSTVSGRRIVIDAGHGGRDPGAIGRTGLREKEVNLDIAKRLKRLFSRVGVYVVMIREEDIDYGGAGASKTITHKRRDLIYRVRKANESKADLLLSIHVNSFPQSIWSGAQCFYDTSNPKSKVMAEHIQKQLVQKLGPNRRKARAADYMILKSTNIPSVTVEVGFISNPREEKLLADADYREKIAEAIFAGTIAYLSEEAEVEGAGVQERTSTVGKMIGKVYPELPPPPLAPGYARLFFTAPYSEDIELWSEERDLGFTEKESLTAKGEILLTELIKGPGESSALLPCLPPGEWIKGLNIGDAKAVVDLKTEIVAAVDGGVASELLTLYSLVNTLAVNFGLDEITILIDGKEGYSLGGHIILDEPVKPREDLIHQTR